ncbi:hypothetical protein MNBD_CPR01-157, partial [hydrothermal vent metagenome]
GMTIMHLGAMSDTMLPPKAREAIENIDILFVPVGGDGVLNASEAKKLSTVLEPHIIIPMHWSGMGEPKALDSFLQESGDTYEKVDKLTIKKKDMAEKEGAIIVVTE